MVSIVCWVCGLPLYDVTVEELLYALKEIDKYLNEVREKIKNVKVNYVNLDFNDALNIKGVLSSDSSYVRKGFAYVTLYVIQTVGLKRQLNVESSAELVKAKCLRYPHTNAESEPEHVIERIVKMTSRLQELQLLKELLGDESGYIAMLDGSLISFLTFALKGIRKEKREEVKKLWEEIRDTLKNLSQKTTLVFISKSVRLNYYARRWFTNNPKVSEEINDVAVLNYFRKQLMLPLEPHMINPIIIDKNELPPPLNREEFDVSGLIPMTITYASFSYGGPYYQVSIPGKREVDEVRKILSTVMKYSTNGYPEPLRIAHIKCKLKTSEIASIMLKLGYDKVITGREPLGEFL